MNGSAFGPARSRYRPIMELHTDLQAAIDAGVHGHLVTINPDGSPQVTVVWLGRDGDEVLVAHLGDGKKMRNVERDPRLTVSFELTGTSGPGLMNYAVLHGTGRVTEGGAADLLQALAPRFMGAGVKFPPMDNPPPGRILHITVDRVTGMGPWAG
jgi:PPOX class probable F420-dependent enzyme